MPLYNPSSGTSLTVEEEDGTPSIAGVTKIQVPNTSLTNDSGTIVSLAYALTSGAATSVTMVGCRAVSSAGTTMTTAVTEYPVAFAAADTFDTDAFHDPATNNTRITIPTGKDGYYIFSGLVYVPVTTGATNYLDLKVRINGAAGAAIAHLRIGVGDGNPIINLTSGPYSMVATDYAELYVMSNVASRTTDAAFSRFSCARVGT